jgi:hypothetical protein
LLVLFCAPAWAGNVIFYAPLDAGPDASYAAGEPAAMPAGDVLLRVLPIRSEKGVVGAAAWVDSGRFSYPAGANFRADQGAIALWVRPNWPGTDASHYHVLFSADGWGMIYKYTDQTYLTFGVRDEKGVYSYGATADIQSWRPGEWRHVVGAWSLRERFRRIYIDGKKVCDAALDGVAGPPASLTIGAYGTRYALDGLVDEVYVFDAPLSDAEVAAGYERGRQGQRCWGVPRTEVPAAAPGNLPATPVHKPPAFVNWSIEGACQRDNGSRGEICLNGFWRYQAAAPAKPPAATWLYRKAPWSDAEFQVYDDKKQPLKPPEARRCWAQREIKVPASWKGRRIVLRLEGARGVAQVYLDGGFRGAQIAMEPVDLDLTDPLRDGGPHTLTVLSEGISDDVWLRSGPEKQVVEDLAIESSTRKKTLRLLAKVENRSTLQEEVRAVAVISNDPAGAKVVKRITGEKPVKCDPKALRSLELVDNLSGLALWTPESPALYWLSLELRDSQDKLLDRTLPVRFGVREFWIEGGDFILNGRPIRLRGHSNVPLHTLSGNGSEPFIRAFFSAMKALDLNSFYTMWAYFYALKDVGVGLDKVLDIADEMGIMAMPDLTNPIHFDGAWEEAFIREHYKARITNLVKRYRYHPSVVMWLAGGGLAHTYDFCPARMDGSFRPDRAIEEIGKAASLAYEGTSMVRRADPTRPVFYHSSGNYGPAWTTMAYLGFDVELQEREDWPLAWARRRHKPVMVTEFGFPVVLSWHKLKRPSPTLKEVYESDPLFVEYAAMYFGDDAYRWETRECAQAYGPPPNLSVLRSQSPAMSRTKALFARNGLRAWRAYGISFQLHAEMASCFETTKVACDPNLDPRRPGGTTDKTELAVEDATRPTELGVAVRDACSPLLACIGGPGRDFTSKDHAFYPGEQVRKQLVVVNDTSSPAEAQIAWTLEDARGEALFAGQVRAQLDPGEIAVNKYPLEFALPETDQRVGLTLKMDTYFGNGQHSSDALPIQVFPRPKAPAAERNRRLVLLDPLGDTEKLLRSGGYKFDSVRKEGALSSPVESLALIGRSALVRSDAASVLNGLRLDEAVRRGLNVLVFEQPSSDLMGLRLRETSPRHVFIRAAGHPVLAGLRPEDFHDWSGESNLLAGYPDPGPPPKGVNEYPEHFWRWGNRGCVATNVIEKPQRGVFRPLLDCGFDLFETPLVEFLVGRGRVVFCQLDVTNRYATDPVARRLADNLIAYLSETPPPAPSCAFAGDGEDKAMLETLGLPVHEFRTADAENACPLVIVGKASEQAWPEIVRYVRNGAWAVCLAGQGQGPPSGLLDGVQGEQVSFFKAALPPAGGAGESPFLGVSPADLFLRGFRPATAFRDLPSSAEATEPAVLTSLPLGQGRIILCGLPIRNAGSKDAWQTMKLRRILTIIAANAGVSSNLGPRLTAAPEAQDTARSELYPEPLPNFDPYRYWRW